MRCAPCPTRHSGGCCLRRRPNRPDGVGRRRRAALGLPVEAAEAAEAVGLVTVGESIAFRHPLVRSPIYGAAYARARRAVHRALADAARASGDVDLRAVHRAAAQSRPDEMVATELSRARGSRRGARRPLRRAPACSRAPWKTPPGVASAISGTIDAAKLQAAAGAAHAANGPARAGGARRRVTRPGHRGTSHARDLSRRPIGSQTCYRRSDARG